eukprot:8131376-Lingulodinium_polyedra.AAC.1
MRAQGRGDDLLCHGRAHEIPGIAEIGLTRVGEGVDQQGDTSGDPFQTDEPTQVDLVEAAC